MTKGPGRCGDTQGQGGGRQGRREGHGPGYEAEEDEGVAGTPTVRGRQVQ